MKPPIGPMLPALALAMMLALSVAAATPAKAKGPRRPALPQKLWALELDGKGSVRPGTLKSYRAQGVTAVVTSTRRVSGRRVRATRRGASAARLVFLGSRPAARGACAAVWRRHQRCVLEATNPAGALRLARPATADLVVVRLRDVGLLQGLRGRSRGRILALARLDGTRYDARRWAEAVAVAAADPRLDLGVRASASRRGLAVRRFGALLRAQGPSGPSPPPPPPAPPAPPVGSAYLWVDTNGGSCARQPGPASYDDGAACGSFAAAYAAAQDGDTVGVKAGTYPAQPFAGDGGQPAGTKRVSFHGEAGTLVRQLSASSPNLAFDGFAFGGAAGPAVVLGNAHNLVLKNSSIGDIVDEKGAIMDGNHMTIDNVVFHDVVQVSPGVHNECLYIMVPDYLVMRNSTFRNCATMDVNMNYPPNWGYEPPPYGHVTLENNVFAHSVNGLDWHYYGFVLGGTGPNSSAPACAQGDKAATYMVGWVVRHNTFENNALITGCAIDSRWVGNLGQWDCVAGMAYSKNVGEHCGASDYTVPPPYADATPYGWRNPGAWDFHLTGSSVAINRGDAADHPATDRDGKARGGAPDAGAFEY